jgi:hypothetical protein
VLKFGGEKALTKNLNEDALKVHLSIEDSKIEIMPKILDHTLVIGGAQVTRKPKATQKMKVRMVKSKVPVKKTSGLEKATAHLYDLEDACGPEKKLNIDLGLYQMEDY